MALEYPKHADKAIFVDLLAQGFPETDPATEVQLDAWIDAEGISFTTAIDPPGVGQGIVNDLSAKENAFLIELQSMKIVGHEDDPAKLYSAIDAL